MARLLVIAAVCSLAGVARADRVHLASGAVIEGEAARQGDRVVVRIESGTFGVPADQVIRIESSVSPVERVDRQRAELEPRDVAGRLKLASYCRDHDLRAKEEQLLREIIEISPDHAEARARLGHVRQGEVWIERVQHEGRWVTREQLLEIERLRAQARIAADEASAAAQRRQKAEVELEATRAELELRKQRAATAEAEATAAQNAAPPVYYYWAAPYAFPFVHPPACRGTGCAHRASTKRPDGRPPWPIVGTKDPFDYLR